MPEWFDEEIKVVENIAAKVPTYLYQYKSLIGKRKEWLKDLVIESNLYFSKASQFNDPLDCRIPPDFSGTSLKIESYWRSYIRRRLPPNGKLRDHKDKIKSLIKESRTKKGQEKFSKNVFKTLDKLGILCLTETPNNMLMWSYYADGHKGVCLKFKIVLENILLKKEQQIYPLKIEYTNTFPNTNFYSARTTDFNRALLGTKAKAWEHEEEWRFILNGMTGKISCPAIQLDGIIIGMRTSKENETSIRKWIANSDPSIKLFRVVNKYRTFELEILKETI